MLIKDPARRPSMRKILEKDFLSKRISKLLTSTIVPYSLPSEERITSLTSNLPEVTKPQSDIDGDLVRRQTFTRSEYKSFTTALSKTYVAPVSVKNNVSESEWFDRQLARHYFLFAANSGMRSGELRKLRWEDVEIETVGGGNTPELKLAKVVVPALNSKVRKFRKFYSVGGVYLERWGKDFAKHRSGLLFSRDGETELHNSFFNKHFRRVMALTKIEKKRRDQLVPYSLRHFCITQRVMSGVRFSDVANMCGTSSGQVERTYFHLNEEMMKRTATAKYTVKDGIAVPLVSLLDETI
jgi:integrase